MVFFPAMDISSIDLSLVRWIVPPLIGAVIGYVTNVIAIRMLFRPLTEKRLLGIHLPMTPGIIPKQRHQLAESIGTMVSRDLITEDAVRSQLSSPAFSTTLQRKFRELTELLLYTSTGDLPKKITLPKIEPSEFESSDGEEHRRQQEESADESGADVPRIVESKRGRPRGGADFLVNHILTDFFQTEGFTTSIRKTIEYALLSLSKQPLSSLVGENGEKLFSIVSAERVERLREPAKIHLRLWIREQVRLNRRLSVMLTPTLISGIGKVLDHLYPSLFQAFLDYLHSPSIHTKLEVRGKALLRRILEKLSNFQRFFVLAGQYDRTLDERMDVVIDDVLDQLKKAGWDYENRKRLIDTIEKWLGGVSEMTAGELMSAWRGDMIEDAGSALDALFDWIGSEEGGKTIGEFIQSIIRKVSDEQIGTALYRLTGIEIQAVSRSVSYHVVSMVSSGDGKKSADGEEGEGSEASSPVWTLVKNMAEEISHGGENSIAEIIGLTDEDRDRLETESIRLFLRVLNDQVPHILESVDVRDLVVQKIDSLDIERVEDLVLQVIRNHLRWISLFGGILGFLIGSIQVLFFIFTS